MNYKGYILLALMFVAFVFGVWAVALDKVADDVWLRSVETRLEEAARGKIDITNVYMGQVGSENVLYIFAFYEDEMIDKEIERYEEEVETIAREADAIRLVMFWIEPDDRQENWYIYAYMECPTNLISQGDYSMCTTVPKGAGLYQVVENRHLKWRNE